MLVTPQNCTKMLRNLTFVSCTICSLQILASDQNKFLLFWATFEQLSLLTKSHFWLFFGQRFEKLRETFWKISSNLWKALAEVPKYPLFLAETYLRNAAFRYPETVFDWLHHQLHHSHLLFSIVSHPSLPRSCPFHSFFFFPFLSFSFFDGQFSYRLSRLCPDKLWAWCDVDPHHPHIHETDLIVKSVYT